MCSVYGRGIQCKLCLITAKQEHSYYLASSCHLEVAHNVFLRVHDSSFICIVSSCRGLAALPQQEGSFATAYGLCKHFLML